MIYHIILYSLFMTILGWKHIGAQSQLPRRSPTYKHQFQYPLPFPPVKSPLATFTDPHTGVPIDFYEVKITPFKQNFFPNLQDASLVGYDGVFPGPVFQTERGRETVVRFVNKGFRPASIHLHGSFTRSPWDGWPEDLIPPGHYKDFYYPNKATARTLWYHDHADKLTTLNTYAGQVGFYIIRDSAVETKLRLPQGQYDILLLLDAHFFTSAGDFSDESQERTSTYGDTFTVNGRIQPYLIVEPRKYRFRLLDASVSRTFNLTILAGKTAVPFWVVASDGGFREAPAETKSLVLSMAERWEIIVDFAKFIGKNLTLTQKTVFVDEDYAGNDEIMQFRVGKVITDMRNNSPLPKKLVDINFPPVTNSPKIERNFNFVRNIGQPWTINGKPFSNPMNRVVAKPSLGVTEKWFLRGTGGWSHPVHLHMVDIQLLSRGVGNPNQKPGRNYLENYEQGAVKDIAVLGDNEAVEILAKFVPYEGVYIFHCHNIVHEDFSMMAAFNITELPKFGYGNDTSNLEDPMDMRFRAKQYFSTDLQQVRKEVLPYFASLKAYSTPKALRGKADQYWSASEPASKQSSKLHARRRHHSA